MKRGPTMHVEQSSEPLGLEAMRDALEAFDKRMSEIGGCGDGYCLVTGKAKGMHTNGGCRCGSNRYTAQRAMGAARNFRDAVDAALQLPEAEIQSSDGGVEGHARPRTARGGSQDPRGNAVAGIEPGPSEANSTAAPVTELEDANNACLDLAAKHGFATGHGDTVGGMIREFSAQIRPDAAPVDAGVRERTNLATTHINALKAAEAFEDAASYEETMWTGWGDCVVPPYAEMRRVKAQQAVCALRDAQPAALASQPVVRVDQTRIATKQSTDPEVNSETETAGGEA